jgi:hypothetical protein
MFAVRKHAAHSQKSFIVGKISSTKGQKAKADGRSAVMQFQLASFSRSKKLFNEVSNKIISTLG